jgi:hypothetical protein
MTKLSKEAKALIKDTHPGFIATASAEILSSGELFDQTNAELANRNMKANHLVVVSVEEFVVF